MAAEAIRAKPEQRTAISRYTTENGPTQAAMKQLCSNDNSTYKPVEVRALPTKPQGQPLLLGEELDKCVQDYIKNLREIGGVVNTAIVVGAANGIVAQSSGLLVENGGHVSITKGWAKSILHCMNYVKCKFSNAGKISVLRFNEY